MKISVIQPDSVWEDKSRNFENLGSMISPLYHKTDLVILPEMFNSGFSMNPEKLSEAPEGETFDWMRNLASAGNFGIGGSYIVKDNNQFFNRWVFVSPGKTTWHYDKRHLFSMGGEDRFFSAGKKRLIFSFRGIRISPYVCYDLRFPVWSRNQNEYDLMINSANWPESRINVWNTLIRARAIENQCYVAGSNRTGTDGAGIKYCGNSLIINPKGENMASANPNEESIVNAEISANELTEFRLKFPVFKDSDNFTIDF